MAEALLSNGALRLGIPDGWVDQSVYSFVGPQDPIGSGTSSIVETAFFRPNLIVTRQPLSGLGLKAFADAQMKLTATELPGYQAIAATERTVDGKPAVEHSYTFTANPGARPQQVQGLQLFVEAGQLVYTLTFTTVSKLFSAHKPIFDSILKDTRFVS